MSQNLSELEGGGEGGRSTVPAVEPNLSSQLGYWWRVGREGLGVESCLKPTIWHRKKITLGGPPRRDRHTKQTPSTPKVLGGVDLFQQELLAHQLKSNHF